MRTVKIKKTLNEDIGELEILDEPVELKVKNIPDYSSGDADYMQSIINKGRAKGIKVKFLVPVHPQRKFPIWYAGNDICEMHMSDDIKIVIHSDVQININVTNEEGRTETFLSTTEEIEDFGLYTDDEVNNAYEDGIINFDDSYDEFYFNIIDSRRNIETSAWDLGFEENMMTLDSALDINFYLFTVLDSYEEYIKETQEEKTPTAQEELTEDKASIERFVSKVGKPLSDRFFKHKPRLKSPENDISFWMKKKPEQLRDRLDMLDNKLTRKQENTTAKQGSKLLYSDEDWSVFEILNVEASLKYGKGTKWCISGDGCRSHEMLDFYKNYFGSSKAGQVKIYFYISKMFADKYAVLINHEDGRYFIWNDIDNPVAFILDAPKVPGLPDFSVVPEELKKELAAGLKIDVKDIVSIINSYQEIYPGGDNLEKYSVEYRDKAGLIIIQDLYRSPETDQFIPLEEELNNYF